APPPGALQGCKVAAGLDPRRAGQRERDADDEQEGREDQVGWRAAVPPGMAEGAVDVRPVARVVDEDHRADSQAAHRVDRDEALLAAGAWLHGASLRIVVFEWSEVAGAGQRGLGDRHAIFARDTGATPSLDRGQDLLRRQQLVA